MRGRVRLYRDAPRSKKKGSHQASTWLKTLLLDGCSQLLAVISRLDVLVLSPALQQDWLLYKRLVKRSRAADANRSEAEYEEGRSLEKVILELEERVVKGRMVCYVASSSNTFTASKVCAP